MAASSRTAIAEGRKNTSIANSHNPRLASPNWLAAVVSQRSPTMALMLNSTTSRSRMTRGSWPGAVTRSEEHTSELQSRGHLVCRLLLEKKKKDLLPAETIRQQC